MAYSIKLHYTKVEHNTNYEVPCTDANGTKAALLKLSVYVCVCRDKTYRVVWVRHGIEGSHSQWVFIQHVEVSIILRQGVADENN